MYAKNDDVDNDNIIRNFFSESNIKGVILKYYREYYYNIVKALTDIYTFFKEDTENKLMNNNNFFPILDKIRDNILEFCYYAAEWYYSDIVKYIMDKEDLYKNNIKNKIAVIDDMEKMYFDGDYKFMNNNIETTSNLLEPKDYKIMFEYTIELDERFGSFSLFRKLIEEKGTNLNEIRKDSKFNKDRKVEKVLDSWLNKFSIENNKVNKIFILKQIDDYKNEILECSIEQEHFNSFKELIEIGAYVNVDSKNKAKFYSLVISNIDNIDEKILVNKQIANYKNECLSYSIEQENFNSLIKFMEIGAKVYNENKNEFFSLMILHIDDKNENIGRFLIQNISDKEDISCTNEEVLKKFVHWIYSDNKGADTVSLINKFFKPKKFETRTKSLLVKTIESDIDSKIANSVKKKLQLN